jgi:hypothetical protein
MVTSIYLANLVAVLPGFSGWQYLFDQYTASNQQKLLIITSSFSEFRFSCRHLSKPGDATIELSFSPSTVFGRKRQAN